MKQFKLILLTLFVFVSGLNLQAQNRKAMFFNSQDSEWLPDFVSAWKFQNNSNDAISTNDGTDTSMSYVSGLIGQAADFTAGTSSGIEVADDDALSFGNGSTDTPFSISLLIKWSTVGSTVIFTKKDTSTGAIDEYQIDYTGTVIQFFVFDNDTSNYISIAKTQSFTADTWYHIACTYDGSAVKEGLSMYIDGTFVPSGLSLVGTYVAMHNTGEPITIGKNAQSTTRSLNGYMDDTILWNRELSQNEVGQIAADQLAGKNIID